MTSNIDFCILVHYRLFMRIESIETMLFHQLITLGTLEIFTHHFGDQFSEADFGCPAEFDSGFAGITQQGLDLGRAEVAGVNRNDTFARGIIAFFVYAHSSPSDRYANLFGSQIDEV